MAEFGKNGTIVLEPQTGDAALAEANGRFGFFIQGGKRSNTGLLRPTDDGSLRLRETDQRQLVAALRQMGDVRHRCIIVASAREGAKVAVVSSSKSIHTRRKATASFVLASTMAAEVLMGTMRQVLTRTAWQAGVAATITVPGVLVFTTQHSFAQDTSSGKQYPDAQLTVKDYADQTLNAFVSENKDADGKAYLTSGDRTAEEQAEIILDPKRANNYLPIKSRFEKQFGLTTLPAYDDLTSDQKDWMVSEINKEAGKSPGFPHVGGKAQDISVKNLTEDEKTALAKKLASGKYGVLNEKVTGTTSDYGVDIKDANVLHVYQK